MDTGVNPLKLICVVNDVRQGYSLNGDQIAGPIWTLIHVYLLSFSSHQHPILELAIEIMIGGWDAMFHKGHLATLKTER